MTTITSFKPIERSHLPNSVSLTVIITGNDAILKTHNTQERKKAKGHGHANGQ